MEARVPVETLGDDRYELDAMGLRLVGQRSGHAYALGDRLEVRIEDVSVEAREVRVVVVGEAAAKKTPRGKAERGRGDAKREPKNDRKPKNDRRKKNSAPKRGAKKTSKRRRG